MRKRKMISALFAAAAISFALPLSARAATPGWSLVDGAWYYFLEDGTPANGVKVINREAYTFDDTGRMVLDGVHIDGFEDALLEQAYVSLSENWGVFVNAQDELNRTRASYGIGPIYLDYDFCLLACYRAEEIIEHDQHSHYKPDGTAYCDEEAEAYFHKPMDLGEVLVRHQHETPLLISPDEVSSEALGKLMTSPPHKESLLTAEFTRLGVGVKIVNDLPARDYKYTFIELLR